MLRKTLTILSIIGLLLCLPVIALADPPCAPSCGDCDPADFNFDGSVNPFDLAILLGSWGPCPEPPANCPADLDGDGFVNAFDLAILLGSWG